MKTQVVITFQIEGCHYWLSAEETEPVVSFLSFPHRHMFHVKVYKPVYHDDRDIEFICFKREVISYMTEKYYNKDSNMLEFRGMSCEMIAAEIL